MASPGGAPIPVSKECVVIKVGTSSLLSPDTGLLALSKVARLVDTIAELKKKKDCNVVLVSSGAVGFGCQSLNLSERPDGIIAKQALAAIGQASLMRYYNNLFGSLKLTCAQVSSIGRRLFLCLFHNDSMCGTPSHHPSTFASSTSSFSSYSSNTGPSSSHLHIYFAVFSQILLTYDNLGDQSQYRNAKNTFAKLFEWDVIPIVNENDTVAVGCFLFPFLPPFPPSIISLASFFATQLATDNFWSTN